MTAFDLLDPADVARLLGVRPATVHQWRYRRLLPPPAATFGSTPTWHRATIEEWARATGRLPIASALPARHNPDHQGGNAMTTIYIASVSPANGGDYELGPEWHPTTLDGETLAEHAERHDLTILDEPPAAYRGLIRNESHAHCWFLGADGQLEAVLGALSF